MTYENIVVHSQSIVAQFPNYEENLLKGKVPLARCQSSLKFFVFENKLNKGNPDGDARNRKEKK